MACRGRKQRFGTFCLSGNFPGAPGNGRNGPLRVFPQGMEVTRRLAGKTHPSPGKTFHIILPPQTRRFTGHASLPAFRGEPPDACAQPQLSAPVYSQPAPFTTCLRLLRPTRAFCGPLHPLRPSRTLCGHSCAFTAHPAPFTAHPAPFATYSALFTAYSASFTAFPHLLRPLHACLRPIRAFNGHPVPFYGFPTPFTTTPRLFMTSQHVLRPTHAAPFTAPTAPFTTCSHLLRPICAFYGFPAPVCGHSAPFMAIPRASAKGSFLPFPPPPSSPRHPAGRTAGPARTRSRVQTLEDPFWGTSARFPRLPVPKTPQTDGPCSWAVRRVCALSLNRERNEASPPPARGAGLRDQRDNGTGRRHSRQPRAEGTGSRHCRPAGGKSLLVDLPPSIPTFAPFGTKRRTPAPCSWGGRSSTSSRRHWPSALPTTRGSSLRRRIRPCGRLRG